MVPKVGDRPERPRTSPWESEAATDSSLRFVAVKQQGDHNVLRTSGQALEGRRMSATARPPQQLSGLPSLRELTSGVWGQSSGRR